MKVLYFCLAIMTGSSFASALKFSRVGKGVFDRVGYRAYSIGDYNNDGVNDFVWSSPGYENGVNKGRMEVLSGLDGSPLLALTGLGQEAFGYGVISQHINDDGILDFIVGAPEVQLPGGGLDTRGKVHVFKSKLENGTITYKREVVEGNKQGDYFGRSIVWLGGNDKLFMSSVTRFFGGYGEYYKSNNVKKPVGRTIVSTLDIGDVSERKGYRSFQGPDLNGDGIGELVMGAIGQNPSNGFPIAFPGRLYFYSSAKKSLGELLCIIEGPQDFSNTGRSFKVLDDLNGDGNPEVFIGASQFSIPGAFYAGKSYIVDVNGLCANGAEVISLNDIPQRILFEMEGTSAVDLEGFAAAALSDLNYDGIAEYAISANGKSLTNGAQYRGVIQIIDGATGSTLQEIEGSQNGGFFGFWLDSDPSANTLIVGSPFYSGVNQYSGRVDVYQIAL